MIQEIRIGIVEDELLIAEKIVVLLSDIGYTVCTPVSDYAAAINMIQQERPDFLLLDINLGKGMDGIDIAQKINESFFLPFIFLTANSDMATLERAKKVRPNAYLVKPFTREELYTSIEIAVTNFHAGPRPVSAAQTNGNPDFFFIRNNHRFTKVLFRDMLYVESRENYVVVHTVDKKSYTQRATFTDFLTQLPAGMFCRIHRSYAVQKDLVTTVGAAEVTLAGVTLPVTNTYREALFAMLGLGE